MKALSMVTLAATLAFAASAPTVAAANPTSGPAANPTSGLASNSGNSQPLQATQNGRDPRAILAAVAAHRIFAAPSEHFNFPYGVATDQYGNVFVSNVDGNNVVEVSSTLKVLGPISNTSTPLALSVAVDNDDNVYAGSELGYINKFSPSGVLLQKITANASFPSSIAVDEFEDIYIVVSGGVAVDSSLGTSLFSNVLPTTTVNSLTFGGPDLYAFSANKAALGNGETVLRNGYLQLRASGLPSSAPVGAACSNGSGTCWTTDSNVDELLVSQFGGGSHGINLSYLPAGVAYDELHNRLLVADPVNNAVHVYTASTLAFQQTLK